MERPDAPLCAIVLTYVVPLDQIDARMKAHVAWLEQGYDAGLFLASGRRTPRIGGVILCRGAKAEAEALVATDPFVASGAATAEVIAFTASMAADGFSALLA
ncbi:hypothetical protein ASG11_00425 [Sphingomonas sp. Leaf357]|uniref:YciI family protein n=1 Tax=Sphingomonas sp. Leaf357 TaxID=1736350 RepID=UPI0006F1ECAA|nr:YciI family protein [Sphingomonas sp. Leaf357]KQS02930.1 hypothetical protein ASG11_00425 [Sphingomonas sp. Leaf357]